MPPTPPEYPDDADGDALRSVAADGNDMAAPMDLEFPVVVPAEIPAKQFASVAAERGYRVHLWEHEDDADWDVICSVTMVPTHADVVRIQRELTEWAKPFRGSCDSWGTFGNKPRHAPGSNDLNVPRPGCAAEYCCGTMTAMRNEFTAIVEQDGGWFIAYSPEVPGANGQGRNTGRGPAKSWRCDRIDPPGPSRRRPARRAAPPRSAQR